MRSGNRQLQRAAANDDERVDVVENPEVAAHDNKGCENDETCEQACPGGNIHNQLQRNSTARLFLSARQTLALGPLNSRKRNFKYERQVKTPHKRSSNCLEATGAHLRR